ncbi:hypothetical protein Tco_0973945, partial [Tanacetum coccineum]
MESSVQFICVFCGSLSDEYGCPCSTCKLCGNEAHYGYDCPSQVPFVYNQDPCFNQNLDNFPQTSPKEQAATINSLYQNPDLLQSFIYQDDDNDDDDYDEESILSMNTDMFETPSPDAIMTSSPIEEPKDSLIMEDEDINIIPEKESDEENKSSAENLFHIPSESEVTFDICQFLMTIPLSTFLKMIMCFFSRPLFDSYGDTTSSEYSSDNESILNEGAFSNLPFKFDVESFSSDENSIYAEELEDMDGTNYLIDSIIDFSPKIDPILEEFAGEFALINPIPPRIAGADSYPEG